MGDVGGDSGRIFNDEFESDNVDNSSMFVRVKMLYIFGAALRHSACSSLYLSSLKDSTAT
jgi:hypothetical protein